jgi:hypothetical protein
MTELKAGNVFGPNLEESLLTQDPDDLLLAWL